MLGIWTWICNHLAELFSGLGTAVFLAVIGYVIKKVIKAPTATVVQFEKIFAYEILRTVPAGGKMIRVGDDFCMTFVLQNTGNFTWTGCYLRCCNEVEGLPSKRISVPVPDTPPGSIAKVRLRHNAVHTGVYAAMWKMYDRDHFPLFGEEENLSVEVRVSR